MILSLRTAPVRSHILSAIYFAGSKAPEYILLKDDTIYGHIKYLENPLTWEALKNHYSVADVSDYMLLLKKDKQINDCTMALLNRDV